jgi:hypothetical protein
MSRLMLVSALALLTPLAGAQESKAIFDAPVVVVPSLNRITHLVELDGTPGYEAFSWWWDHPARDGLDVRAWDVDPVDGFLPGFSKNYANPILPYKGGGYVRLIAANVDANGRDDLILITNKQIRIFTSNGLAEPTEIQTWTGAEKYVEGFAIDVDGDGDDDLALIDELDTLTLHENLGAAQSWQYGAAVPASVNLGTSNSRVRAAELTGDATPDLFFVRDDAIVFQPIAANFTLPAEITYPTVTPLFKPNPAVGDIDGDGDEDAVVFAVSTATGGGRYTVLRRLGPATFLRESVAKGGPATDLVDLDGDGDLDGACCGGGGGASSGAHSWHNRSASYFELCHNDGTGAFTPAYQMTGLGADRLVAGADIDFDGDVDLVAGRVVYYSPGGIAGPFETAVAWGEHRANLICDLENDGDPDIALTLDRVLRSDATGSVKAKTPVVQAPQAPEELKGPGYAGDFDGDGDEDLLVARWASGAFQSMCLLANTGGGHFVDAGDAGAPGVSFSQTGDDDLDPRGAWAVDFDGDLDLDLFTWKPIGSSPNTTMWMNDGTGFFTSAPGNTFLFLPGYFPQAVDDYNNDQNLDLVASSNASSSSNTVNVLLFHGDGAGGFVNWTSVGNTGYQNFIKGELGSIASGDFDNDGDPDLVACNQSYYTSGSSSFFENVGQGYFNQTTIEPPGPIFNAPDARAIVADVNGDGWSDVLISPLDSGASAGAILLRNPDGVLFQPMIEQIVMPVQAADFDGDGDVDVIDSTRQGTTLADDRIVHGRRYMGELSGMRKQVGKGVKGSGGLRPTLGATGPFRFGESITLHLTGAAPGTTARLLRSPIAPDHAGLPSNGGGSQGSYAPLTAATVRPEVLLELTSSGAPTDPAGTGTWSQTFPNSPQPGRAFVFSIEIDDAEAVGGRARTNELVLYFGE